MRSNIDISGSDEISSETDDNLRHLLCCICKNVLMKPLVCSGCGTAGCANCLNVWKTKDANCPSGCQSFSYGKPSKFLLVWLDKLKIKCSNLDRGCTETMKHSGFEEHVEKCPFGLVACPNIGCDETMNRSDLEAHSEKCKHTESNCDKCHTQMTKETEGSHSCIGAIGERLKTVESLLQ